MAKKHQKQVTLDTLGELAAKFTEEECEAYCWLKDCGVRFLLDIATGDVRFLKCGEVFTVTSLVTAAIFHGWNEVPE